MIDNWIRLKIKKFLKYAIKRVKWKTHNKI